MSSKTLFICLCHEKILDLTLISDTWHALTLIYLFPPLITFFPLHLPSLSVWLQKFLQVFRFNWSHWLAGGWWCWLCPPERSPALWASDLGHRAWGGAPVHSLQSSSGLQDITNTSHLTPHTSHLSLSKHNVGGRGGGVERWRLTPWAVSTSPAIIGRPIKIPPLKTKHPRYGCPPVREEKLIKVY